MTLQELISKQLRLEVEIAELSLLYTQIKIWERRNDNGTTTKTR